MSNLTLTEFLILDAENNDIRLSVAKRKEHRCSTCGRKIPLGHKYWVKNEGQFREHTNCNLYVKEELLPDGFNRNRKLK